MKQDGFSSDVAYNLTCIKLLELKLWRNFMSQNC
uniref:Uncharacterized protein n=1 Tax=Arundo donax TaxID=35708 RepID=A0A0A8ZZK4_ARUDO